MELSSEWPQNALCQSDELLTINHILSFINKFVTFQRNFSLFDFIQLRDLQKTSQQVLNQQIFFQHTAQHSTHFTNEKATF